jgi:hypothetical protein
MNLCFHVVKKENLKQFIAGHAAGELFLEIQKEELKSEEEVIQIADLIYIVVGRGDLEGVFSESAIDQIMKLLDCVSKHWMCKTCKVSNPKFSMISCDGCNNWHHHKCLGLDENDDPSDLWKCKTCSL